MDDNHDHHLRRLRNEARAREEEQYEYNQRLKRDRQAAERREEQNMKYLAIATHLSSYVILVVMVILVIYFTAEYIKSKANGLIAKLPGLPGDTNTNAIGVSRSTATTWASLHLCAITILSFLVFFMAKPTTVWNFFSVGVMDILLFVLCILGPVFSFSGLYDGASSTLLVVLSVTSALGILLLGVNVRHKQLKKKVQDLLDGDVFDGQIEQLKEHETAIERRIRDKDNNLETTNTLKAMKEKIQETIKDLESAVTRLKQKQEDGEDDHTTMELEELGRLYNETVKLIKKVCKTW